MNAMLLGSQHLNGLACEAVSDKDTANHAKKKRSTRRGEVDRPELEQDECGHEAAEEEDDMDEIGPRLVFLCKVHQPT